jgi:hypothetical protein
MKKKVEGYERAIKEGERGIKEKDNEADNRGRGMKERERNMTKWEKKTGKRKGIEGVKGKRKERKGDIEKEEWGG